VRRRSAICPRASTIRNWWRGTKGFREERPNLFVYSPLVVSVSVFADCPVGQPVPVMRSLRRRMRATGFLSAIVWTFLPTPLALDLLRELDPQLTILLLH
jgi:hypothetical protein